MEYVWYTRPTVLIAKSLHLWTSLLSSSLSLSSCIEFSECLHPAVVHLIQKCLKVFSVGRRSLLPCNVSHVPAHVVKLGWRITEKIFWCSARFVLHAHCECDSRVRPRETAFGNTYSRTNNDNHEFSASFIIFILIQSEFARLNVKYASVIGYNNC